VLIATASTQAVSGVLGRSDIRTAVKTLLGNNARMISNLIPAGQGQGTTPVRPAYWGILHTDLVDDLEDITGFKSTAEYPRQEPVMQAEWGATDNVRWLLSTKADKDTTASPDEYDALIIAQDAYGETEIEGSSQNIVKAFGQSGTSDPLNQRATSGWKMTYVCRILNDSFLLNLTAINHS
jgi:N4-gp56 family major capsid protein